MVLRWIVVAAVCFGVWGCGNSGSPTYVGSRDPYLLCAGASCVSVSEFNHILEMAKVGYPSEVLQDIGGMQALKVNILKQFKEELIILERARELEILVTDPELAAGIQEIQHDFPGDLFSQEFLDSAVSRRKWEKRLKVRLLMQKVLAQDLKAQLSLSADDIARYTKEAHQKELVNFSAYDDEAARNKVVVNYLNMRKKQEAYAAWIEQMRGRYPIKMNKRELEALFAS